MSANLTDQHWWTYGCEHELADISWETPLPRGFGRDTKDYTIVNSNGVANDPKGKLYRFGGELNTPPSNKPEGQAQYLRLIRQVYPEAKVNYRSNLHVHIRVPNLKDDLLALKQVQAYIHAEMPKVFPVVEPIPHPTRKEFPIPGEYEGAKRRYKRRLVSHHCLLKDARLEHQLAANTTEEFFAREVPRDKAGNPLWSCQPRLCVSLRQLLQTDTVEFRHFPGTLDDRELLTCIQWCRRFMLAALDGDALEPHLAWAANQVFPKFPPYIHELERRYRATVHDGSVPKDRIALNIRAIEEGTFR